MIVWEAFSLNFCRTLAAGFVLFLLKTVVRALWVFWSFSYLDFSSWWLFLRDFARFYTPFTSARSHCVQNSCKLLVNKRRIWGKYTGVHVPPAAEAAEQANSRAVGGLKHNRQAVNGKRWENLLDRDLSAPVAPVLLDGRHLARRKWASSGVEQAGLGLVISFKSLHVYLLLLLH